MKKIVRQQNNSPTRKVTFAAIAGAFTIILVWIMDEILFARILKSDLTLPSEVSSAITTVIAFLIAYYTAPSEADGVIVESIASKPNALSNTAQTSTDEPPVEVDDTQADELG